MRRRRHHDITRLVREQAEEEARARKHFWQNVLIVKTTVMVGLLAATFLPPEHSSLVALSANFLWLWRT